MHRELRMTFVFVTHDQGEALTLSDRIAVFNEGRVEQVGTPAELYERPSTLFVARFLGESTTFPGTVDCTADVLVGDGFQLRAAGVERAMHQRRGVLVVRPERLRLTADAITVPERHNRLTATITQVVYVGNHHQIGLQFDCGLNGTAMRVVDSALPAQPGEKVLVSWDPNAQSVVADTGGSSSDAEIDHAISAGV